MVAIICICWSGPSLSAYTIRAIVSRCLSCFHFSSACLVLDRHNAFRVHYIGANLYTVRIKRKSVFTYIQMHADRLCVYARIVLIITKPCLYNFDPLKPHFYVVKLGFTGVYIIFLISAQKHRGGSNENPQSMFWAEIWKISEFFYLKIFSFWRWIFLYIWIGVFS